MVGEEFWQLIERTRPPEPDPEVHAWKISRALVDGGLEATTSFDRAFREALDALCTWDLWGVGYLALGGLSDDGFEDLRSWIVGQGRKAWEQARSDPEAYLVEVLSHIDDAHELVEHLVDLGIADGEHLIYAAGNAHQELTGEWPSSTVGDADPGAEPAGEAWEEDDLPGRFPVLHAALPAGWDEVAMSLSADADDDDVGEGEAISVDDALAMQSRASVIAQAAVAAEEAWQRGDHAMVVHFLTAVFDDHPTWSMLSEVDHTGITVQLAYMGGMSRLQTGDVDGAAEWMGRVADHPEATPPLRRGLAQIELSLGNLDRAEALLDTSAGAAPMDLAVATAVAGYRLDHDEVVRRTAAMEGAIERPGPDLHPWDVAGMCVLAGLALVEVGEQTKAMALGGALRELLDGAPPELPLVAQRWVLAAGAHRSAGDLAAAEVALAEARPLLRADTGDLGLAEREAARIHRLAGRPVEAAEAYASAVATFEAAGQRFLAESTRREAGTAPDAP